jgi:OOP family OmpA-OmpF porin
MVGAALLATAITAGANEGLYLGPSLSYYMLDNNRTVNNNSRESTVLSGNLGYRFAGPMAVELGYGTEVDGYEMDALKLDLLYYLQERNGLAPYFVLGYSNFQLDEATLQDEDDTDQLGAGFGLSKTWGGHWQVRGDGRFLEKFSDGEDATDLAFSLGLNYYFNAPAPAAEPAPVAEPEPAPPATRTITVKLNVLFEFDKADVRAIYGDELNAVANAMKQHGDIDLVLEGHTDAMGSDAYNQDLSLRRVEAVKAKLASDYGIPGNRISTVGYGESRPIADNSTAEGRAQNRRVIGVLSFSEVVSD